MPIIEDFVFFLHISLIHSLKNDKIFPDEHFTVTVNQKKNITRKKYKKNSFYLHQIISDLLCVVVCNHSLLNQFLLFFGFYFSCFFCFLINIISQTNKQSKWWWWKENNKQQNTHTHTYINHYEIKAVKPTFCYEIFFFLHHFFFACSKSFFIFVVVWSSFEFLNYLSKFQQEKSNKSNRHNSRKTKKEEEKIVSIWLLIFFCL